MATVEDALRLFDGFSAPLNRILNALDLTNSALEDMQRLSTSPVDTSAIDGMRDAVLEAGAAYRQMLNEMERIRQNVENSACNVSPVDLLAALRTGRIDPSVPPVDIPVNPPVIPPVTWSSNNLDVFTSRGAERYELEIQSANDMLERLNDTQSRITQQAESVSFLPADAVMDIQMLQNRIENLRTAIQQTEQNPLDIDSDKANAQLENLRSQLDQIRNSQVSLNNAMQGMNIENINAAYLQLSQNVGSVERSVRDHFSQPPTERPVTWNTHRLDVFTTTGTQRFEREVRSANDMMNTLEQNQQRIAAHAAESNIFPPNAVADLSGLQNQLQAVQSRIAQIASHPANIGSEHASNGLERLRTQLNQALSAQEALNRAADGLDVSAANDAYNRLSEAVNSTTQYIRDNTDGQGRFHQTTQQETGIGNHLMNAMSSAIGSYITPQTLGNVISLSDTMTQTRARLSLIVDDGGSIEALQNKIYASSQNARSSYLETAETIFKLGTQAPQAFSSNDELIAFTELLNKQFVNAGTSKQGMDSVMQQITQAMASGKLEGEGLNTILDNAAPIAQEIQRYLEDVMGVDASNIRELASEGIITADIIKNAMFYAAKELCINN